MKFRALLPKTESEMSIHATQVSAWGEVHMKHGAIQSQLLPAAPDGNPHSLLHVSWDNGSNSDLPPAEVIIEHALQPADKVAGSHCLAQGKAKAKAVDPDTPASLSKHKVSPATITAPVPNCAKLSKITQKELAPKKDLAFKCIKRGHQLGSLGYSPADLTTLFDLIENYLPISAKEWEKVEVEHETYCKENNRATCTARVLELKFKQV
jgi:hypothetical protein